MSIGKSDYDILCEIKNKQSVTEVITRNCQGIDRADSDLFLSTYHEDALVELDDFCGSPGAYYERTLTGTCHKVLESLHFVSNIFVEIDDMTRTIAACESYFQAIARIQRGDKIFDLITFGRYVDHLECRTIKERCRMGVWKISRRIVMPSSDRLELVVDQIEDFRDRNNSRAEHIKDAALLSFLQRTTVPMLSRRVSPWSSH